MKERVLYVCGVRGFSSQRLGRKLSGVPASWRALGHEVLHICGSDVDDPADGVAPPPEMSK